MENRSALLFADSLGMTMLFSGSGILLVGPLLPSIVKGDGTVYILCSRSSDCRIWNNVADEHQLVLIRHLPITPAVLG